MNSINLSHNDEASPRSTTVSLAEYLDRPHPGHVALACASLGWPVLPFRFVDGLKKPCIKRWQSRATTDPAQIEEWWSRANCAWTDSFPDAYVGVVTGRRSGVWVLDVDRKNGVNGFRTLLDLLKSHGVDDRPNTFIVKTPTGGEHWYFRYPDDGREIANSASNRLGTGLDTRGTGGFAVAPGQSRFVPELNRFAAYKPVVDGVELATAWRWLEDLVEKRKPTRRKRTSLPLQNVVATKLLNREAERLAAVRANAGRNAQLNTSAFFLALNGVDRDAALAALLDACSANGLLADDGDQACLATFDSGWNAGLEAQEESA